MGISAGSTALLTTILLSTATPSDTANTAESTTAPAEQGHEIDVRLNCTPGGHFLLRADSITLFMMNPSPVSPLALVGLLEGDCETERGDGHSSVTMRFITDKQFKKTTWDMEFTRVRNPTNDGGRASGWEYGWVGLRLFHSQSEGREMKWRPGPGNSTDVNIRFEYSAEFREYTTVMVARNLRVAPNVEEGHQPTEEGVMESEH